MARSLLIVGSDRAEALESSYARAFRRLGWPQIHFWDPALALRRVARGGRLGRLFGRFVHVEPWLNKSNQELLRLAQRLQPDLILVIGTGGVRAGTLAQVRVLSPRTLLYCVYPDSPHNLDGERINCLRLFDRVTVSSPAWQPAFEALGARRVHYLPFAADTDLHSPPTRISPTVAFGHDVAFIGSWRPEREAMLEQLTDMDLAIWGGAYWRDRVRTGSPLRGLYGGRAVIGPDFVHVCLQSKIILNIMDPVTWPGPNMRTFEVPACRGFALAERTPAVLELFTEGENIACFGDADEAREHILYYLKHEEQRRRITANAFEFVTAGGHTYVDRARQLLRWAAEDAPRTDWS